MRTICLPIAIALLLVPPARAAGKAATKKTPAKNGWISLFDGRSLDGWKIGGNPSSFKVQDGMIVANGPTAHLFYEGPVENHDFKNFAVKADIMTFPQANSGFYIHTQFQETGFPKKGYEIQVNNSHKDPKRTAGLYGIQDVYQTPAKDNQWFTLEIIVEGKHIVTKVDGKTLVDYTEPKNVTGDRRLSHGTFAIQAHDPNSKVYYKNILVKPLP